MIWQAMGFDLDGTLITVEPEYILTVVRETLAVFNKTCTDEEAFIFWYQGDRSNYIKRTFDIDSEIFWPTFYSFHSYDREKHFAVVYDDVHVLKEVKSAGIKTFLVTGSPQDLMEGKIAVLEQKVLGSNFFDMAISANPKSGNPNKTKPDTLIECMRTLEVPPERTLYVGNSAEDMDFAEKAGVKPIIVKRDIDFPGLEYANIISSLYSLRNMI